jgi:hypothetical protein
MMDILDLKDREIAGLNASLNALKDVEVLLHKAENTIFDLETKCAMLSSEIQRL